MGLGGFGPQHREGEWPGKEAQAVGIYEQSWEAVGWGSSWLWGQSGGQGDKGR